MRQPHALQLGSLVLVCLIVAGSSAMSARSIERDGEEAGRWKIGPGGCYWDANDSGSDQCSPNSGRWKVDGARCYWEANDSGPNQCDPGSTPQFSEARLVSMNNAANAAIAAGAPLNDTSISSPEQMRTRLLPFLNTALLGWGLTNSWILTDYVVVTGTLPPPRDYVFPPFQEVAGYGQVPIAVVPGGGTPRPLTCSQKAANIRQMQSLQIVLGGGAISYSGAAIELRNFPRLAPLQGKFARAGWFHGALVAIVQAWLQMYNNSPCIPDRA